MIKNTSHRQSLPGSDDIIRHTLPNGITLLTRPNFNSPTVVCKGYLLAGSIADSGDLLGLAYFTAAALMTGTKQREFHTLYNTIESLGAHLIINGGTNTTSFSSQCLIEDLPAMLQILAEVLNEPSFPVKQFNRLKAQMLTLLTIRAQNTAQMAAMTFDQLIYKNHPYERPDEGYPETVQAIEIDDLKEFHQNNFGPKGMVISIVGAIEPEEAITQITETLGAWSNPLQHELNVLPELEPLTHPVKQHISIPGKSQTDLVMGTVGPSRLSDDYLACAVGNNILGQFGMMGRIGKAVREKAGLAYYAQTQLNSGIGPGAWEIVAGVNPINLDKTIELIKNEVNRFIEEPVTEEELDDTKSFIIGRLPISLESNSGVAVSLLNLERFNLGLDYLRQYGDMIQSISAEQILTSAGKYLSPHRLAIATAGTIPK